MAEINNSFAEGEEVGKNATSPPESKASDTQQQAQAPAPIEAASAVPPESLQEATETEQSVSKPDQAPASGEKDPEVIGINTPTGSKDPYKPVSMFLAPSGTTPAAILAPANEPDHTRQSPTHSFSKARLLEHTRNRRLLSDKELEEKSAAEEAKIVALKSTIVKVRFPDNTSSDWDINHSETGAFLYEAVRHVMADSSQSFRLFLLGGKTVIKDDSSTSNTLIRT
ncbi:hypothetical protein S40288_05987 [Stachybotrys chartarum IBT 40288]|nr:hypothetical protein S40288_05987 [Stachybotrys chartarum IBT 40288]